MSKFSMYSFKRMKLDKTKNKQSKTKQTKKNRNNSKDYFKVKCEFSVFSHFLFIPNY